MNAETSLEELFETCRSLVQRDTLDVAADTRRYDARGSRMLHENVSWKEWGEAKVTLDARPTRRALQARFAAHIETLFGPAPPRDALLTGLPALQEAFQEWIERTTN